MINILQFAAFFEQWSLNYPFEVKAFIKNIKLLVFMEFLPTEELIRETSEWLGLSQCDGSALDDLCEKAIDEAIESNSKND